MKTALTLAAAAFAWPGQDALAATEPTIDEWEVPYPGSRPRDPYVAPDGAVWFCGQAGGYIGRFDPASGEFTKYDLDDGAGPHNLIVDDDGMVWFAANTHPYIGRLDPATGEVTRYELPDPDVRDAHTMVFDGAGNIWFTTQRGNHVGRLNMGTGEIDLVASPESNSRPYGIKVADDGRPWVALFGSHYLATVDPASLEIDLVELPRFEARPRRLEITGDGAIWYADYAGGYLGRYDAAAGEFEEWQLPGGESARPYGTALDDAGVIWIAEGGVPNRLVSFDTAAGSFTSVTEIPSARGSVRHMYFDEQTREIWFGEDTNFLGRARLQ